MFRAATAVETADTRLTGPPQYPVATRAVQDLLQRHGIDALEHHRPDTTQWHDLLDAIDPRIRADDYWPTLAGQLAEAAHTNNVHQLLAHAAHRGPLPDEMPAAALWWRITDTLDPAVPEPQSVEPASDQALVEVLAAAHRNGDALPLPEPRTHTVAVAVATPYVVTTLTTERYTPDTADAIDLEHALRDGEGDAVAAIVEQHEHDVRRARVAVHVHHLEGGQNQSTHVY